jgi:hypothetical protein
MFATMLRRFSVAVCGVILSAHGADTPSPIAAIRARTAMLPVLEVGPGPGTPKFTVVRFNATPIMVAGERFGAIRVVCPPGPPRSLAWLFSDIGTIDEYDFAPVKGGEVDEGSIRYIYPATASPDVEQEKGGRRASSLPRPWDLFELHMLGVPARLLVPGEEYLIWFRFADQRPTDVLLAATFLDPAAKLEASDLPPIFALPTLGAP